MAVSTSGKIKNYVVFSLYALFMGALIGVFIWAFLWLMGKGIALIWTTLPSAIGADGGSYKVIFTFAICLLGGIIIGLGQKRFGSYPESMDEVMAVVKRDGKYPYDKVALITVMAILPLLFGASIGPEAGLTGVIVGLCYWAGDHFKYAGRKVRSLAQIGISATVGVIFRAPLFGFVLPIESASDSGEDFVVPKSSKSFIYLVAVLGGFGTYSLLSSLLGGGMEFPRLSAPALGSGELLALVPCVLAGIAGGFIFIVSKKVFGLLFSKMPRLPVVKAVIGGLALAACASLLPFMLFSGESDMAVLMETFNAYPVWLLLVIGAVKPMLTALCIESGWRGGHFFPIIFAGLSIGYAMAAIFGCDPVFCVIVSCSALVAYVLRKPVAASLLLLLCFPLTGLAFSIGAAYLASLIPLPKFRTGEAAVPSSAK